MSTVTIVTGGFDPLHSGHIAYFKAAKELGNPLCVGVNSDEWLTRKKGKPFMRYKGLTESKFLPLLHEDAFHKLHNRFTILNNNQPLTDNKASSKKMKRQTKMISLIRNSLEDKDKLKQFNSVINTAFGLTQKKRFYISDYGYANVREVILGEQDKLVRGQNWDKFHLDNIIKWWKKKATKRYDKLKQEGRFRDKVELWTEDDHIQIIR